MRSILLAIAVSVCVGCTTVSAPNEPISVAVFTGGDDGLTQRLADAVRSEFAASPHFRSAASPTAAALRVTIPTHVRWERGAGGLQVSYEVQLAWSGRERGSAGTCMERDLVICARQIVREAVIEVGR